METINDVIKQSKSKLGDKIPCSIEILTPVHIGSGVKLANGIDFIASGDTVTIITQAELMDHLENNSDELELFIKSGYKLDALKKMPNGKKYSINNERVFDISEFERNGFGKPYIPGSSIKGSIRTIIFKTRFDKLESLEKDRILKLVSSTKKEWAAEPLVKEIFGTDSNHNDSNHNLMRTLQIFDTHFDKVNLEKVLILTLRNSIGTSYGWKKMGRDILSQADPSKASPIYVETIPIGERALTGISLSKFLYNNEEAKRELKFTEPSLSNIDSFVQTINSYSLQKLNDEKAFFIKLNSNKRLNDLIKNIDLLIEHHKKLKKDEFILRISWGSGWKGITGDFLSDLKVDGSGVLWLDIFRNKYGSNKGMGKPGVQIFPKTRRIVFEDNEPKYLTGWVKIRFNDSIEPSKELKKNVEPTIDENDWAAKLGNKFKVSQKK